MAFPSLSFLRLNVCFLLSLLYPPLYLLYRVSSFSYPLKKQFKVLHIYLLHHLTAKTGSAGNVSLPQHYVQNIKAITINFLCPNRIADQSDKGNNQKSNGKGRYFHYNATQRITVYTPLHVGSKSK